MNFEFSYPDIVKHCNTMAYLNVISFCLLSGCGNIEMPDEQELDRIYKLLKGTGIKNMPKNITFMSSLYKKCVPGYAAIPESAYDFKGFRWVSKKMKRSVEPNVLAHSISSTTALIPILLNGEILSDNKEFIAYCLGINSIKQACFLVDFLRLGDFYYTGKDIGDNVYAECKITLSNKNPDLKTQFYASEALASILELPGQSKLYPGGLIDKFEKCLEVLPIICENVIENVNDIRSRDLSAICLSLLAMLKHTGLHRQTIYNTVNTIGFEFCERLTNTGDISRNISDDNFSSFVTLCNCMNCLIRLHEFNSMDKYKVSYLKLYDRIDSYWDKNSGLFSTSDKSKQKCSFKDVSALLSALRALRSCLTDPDLFMYVDKQLSSFYSSAFINSKLFNNQFYPILQENKMELHNLGSSEKNMAPVFWEYFEFKTEKKKYYCEPSVFTAEETLLGCKYLLY